MIIQGATINLPLYSGEEIHENIEHNKKSFDETDVALKLLCGKRGCLESHSTPDDTVPIQLLRNSKKEHIDKLQNANSTEYVRLDDLDAALGKLYPNIRGEKTDGPDHLF